MKYLWKIGGEAGFGIMTTGLFFTTLAARSGYNVYDYTEYPSLIRGGHNTTDVVFGDEPVTTNKHMVDMLVCLNGETYRNHKHRLHENSVVIYDENDCTPDGPGIHVMVPFRKIKREEKIEQIMVNTIAFGASLALLEGDIQAYYAMLEQQFGRKGQEVVDFNKRLADIGYNHVKEHYAHAIKPVMHPIEGRKPKVVMTGNDAFALATVVADCRVYSAYPMTPSSTVMGTLAAWEKKTGMVVRHAEDEISAIITALGSSAAGVRSATGTSGGGFALMVEAISYAGIAEVPIVIFLSQRPGPATGMPTWTEQGDLHFAVHSGHGEFPKVVLAAGDIEEMLELTLKSFDLADILQTPIIVMSDKLLSESHESMDKEKMDTLFANYTPNYGKLVKQTMQEPYLRYKIEADGISERLIPGQKGKFYQSNSYEHEENSHTSETIEDKIAQTDKRHRKQLHYLANYFQPPTIYGNQEESELVFVSWSGNKGAILEAQRQLEKEGIKVAYMHFTHLYPMDETKVKPLFLEGKRYVDVENNSTGQLARLIRAETGITIEEKLLRYDGRPLLAEDIVSYVKEHRS